MDFELSPEQRAAQSGFRAFVDEHVSPFANAHDREQRIPDSLVAALAGQGYLGAIAPRERGGGGMDAMTWGLLCEEIGRGSASLLSLLTVHSMVILSLVKWGTEQQRDAWLPKLASGHSIGAFGLTEPENGSDAANLRTDAVPDGGDYLINGEKRWISFGQVADLFLIFARVEGRPAAFLVERGTAGFGTTPITGMLGFRSAMLAAVTLDNCRVPATNLVGRIGFGFSHVAGTALDHGRFCIACGALGLSRGCAEACLDYAGTRRQFGRPLIDHQLIQAMIADMIVQTRAARLMCHHAACLQDRGDPSRIMETSMAKYFASRVAVQAALDSVQVHGANGCSDDYPVARYLRDAKILEIIEGSSQMQQIMIAAHGRQGYAARSLPSAPS